MTWAIRGLIEGFYGRPWSWEERLAVMRWCHERGMTHYLYAPKDDPLHRDRWREPYPREELDGFERLVASDTLAVGFGISPGLTMDYEDADDRRALAAKVEQLLAVGVTLVCLALDDIPPRPGLGEAHARLTTWLFDRLGDRAGLVLVPTEYTGTAPTPYLDALVAGTPEVVPIGWTGETVVCDAITAGDARARTAAVGGRPPLVWDNYPVNDAVMADRLFLGPLRGRAPELADLCSGYVANPMTQPRASRLPLASVAGYLAGRDPVEAWRAAADELGCRAFAEACDGEVPRRLVAAVVSASPGARADAIDGARRWLDGLDAYEPGADLAPEVQPWIDQAGHEAGLWRACLRTLDALERGDGARASMDALALLYLWPAVRTGTPVVMGPRLSFRPVLGQWPDGSWRYDARSLDEDRNATDQLVRFTLAEVGAWAPSP